MPATHLTTRELEKTLKKAFGHGQLRPGQEEVIRHVLAGRDTLAVMPTGAGKSLCYQLPGVRLPGTTVIVSPLLALIRDQEEKLRALDRVARRLDSTVPASEETETLAALAAGEVEFLFVTPERLARPDFQERLAAVPVDFVVIDEAHCVSEWGHDFRPDYLALGDALEAIGRPPFLALTATAGEQVVDDLRRHLRSPELVVVSTELYRENLHLAVRQARGDEEKRELVEAAVRAADGPGIVYVATIRHCDELTAVLRERGLVVAGYHGRMAKKQRQAAQDRFMAGELQAMVATNAFGMGIDKQDLRFVVHHDLPGSLDAYYQEAGRAGRDGRPARCLLCYDPADRAIQAALLARGARRGEDRERARQRRADDGERLRRMERYAQTALCRWAHLLAYFAGDAPETTDWHCGHCDGCERDLTAVEPTVLRARPPVEPLVASLLPGEDEMAVGARVGVPLYGEGTVEAVDAQAVEVRLGDGELRRFQRTAGEAASVDAA